MNLIVMMACCWAISLSAAANQQEDGSVRSWGSWHDFFPDGGVNWPKLIKSRKVLGSIESTTEQQQLLKDAEKKIIQTLASDAQVADMTQREKQQKLNQSLKEEMGRILLPFQVDLLEKHVVELAFAKGFVGKLLERTLSDDYSNKEVREIKLKGLDLQLKVESEVARVRLEAWKAILNELTVEQQAVIGNTIKAERK